MNQSRKEEVERRKDMHPIEGESLDPSILLNKNFCNKEPSRFKRDFSMDKSNESLISRRGFLKSISYAALSTAIFSSFAKRTEADVPDILQIENISQESTGRISLEIRHASPSTNHYVDNVEIDVDGQINQFNLESQDSNPFTVDLELGEIQGTPNVMARAHCNLHGWSGWSDQIEIPEFPIPITVILAALASTLFIVRNPKK